LEPPN